MIYVIGSGPAGVACAFALLDRQCEVTLLDGGITLEPDAQGRLNRMAATAPEQWTPEMLAHHKINVEATTEGLPQKTAFGSNYPYQQTREAYPLERQDVHILPSLARGGLSSVWGAAVLPHRHEDLRDWPITLNDLEPHYRAVLKWLPLSATRDDLERFFPLYSDSFETLQPSRQAQTLFQKLSQNKEALNQQGIYHGWSRLAVRAASREGKSGCMYCGLCLYGCPYGCIYNAEQTLQTLLTRKGFTYRKDVIVRRLDETSQGIKLAGEDRVTHEPLTFSGKHVFLAAGILPTTRILLESQERYNVPLDMVTSQHFMFPMLALHPENSVQHESLYTLSQIFLEVWDKDISPETIHLQIYTYNDLYKQAMKKSIMGLIFNRAERFRDHILNRLLIVQGYLHSRYSDPIELSLSKDGQLHLKGQRTQAVKDCINQLLKKLARNKLLMSALPIRPLLKISLPGQGFHNVGTYPMRNVATKFSSDVLGRPSGYKRVYAVDATVLPSAPATTITLSVMANAHRIGALAPLD